MAFTNDIKHLSNAPDGPPLPVSLQAIVDAQVLTADMQLWPPNKKLTRHEVCAFLGLQGLTITVDALTMAASRGKAPPAVFILGSWRYDFTALRLWAAEALTKGTR